MNKDDKALLWLDSYDFMSYKKKDKLLNLFEYPGDILELKTFNDKKEDILNILTEEEFNILKTQATDYVINEKTKVVITLDNDFNVTIREDTEGVLSSTDKCTVTINKTTGKISVRFVVLNNFTISANYKQYISILPSSMR